MRLFEVFLIIAGAILAVIAVLWLISWLTRSANDKSEMIQDVTTASIQESTEPVKVSAEPTPPVSPVSPKQDDLQKIEGIGPKISEILHQSGIHTFSQLAEIQVIILESILKDADLRIANPSTWPEQAALAADGKWEALEELQEELKAGRKVD